MSKAAPALAHTTLIAPTANGDAIHNSYVIYTPKIITFVYNCPHAPPPASSPSHYKEAHSIELTPSQSAKPIRTPKIKLVSRRTTEINSEKLNQSMQESSRREHVPEKSGLNIQSGSAMHSSHSKNESMVAVFSCGWCTDPNQEQQWQVFPSRMKMRKTESRIIHLDHPIKDNKQQLLPTHALIQNQNTKHADIKPQARLNQIRERRIFEISNSKMSHPSRSLEHFRPSRLRKSIFVQYNAKSRSLSQNTSLQTRKKIFQSDHKRLREERYASIRQIDLPLCIIQSWKQSQTELKTRTDPLFKRADEGLL